jgi:hypothetical protein
MFSATFRRLRGPLLGAAFTVLALTTVTAVAGSGVGGVFNLGEVNTVNAQTTLNGNAAGNPQLRVENSAAAQNAFAVLGRVTAGSPPNNTAGLRGINSGTNANGFGVWGAHQGSGVGVFGETGAGTGVLGKHTAATGGLPGVQGESLSQTGRGVIGVADSGDASIGVFGQSDDGTGVFGSSFDAAGVIGVSSRDVGVAGESLGTEGVLGRALSVTGAGVAGEGPVGVRGSSDIDANSIGVLGQSSTGLAGKFEGDIHSTGRITKAYTSGTSSQAVPIAYGLVRGSDGTMLVGTPNVSSSYDPANKRYLITIAGVTYANDTHVTTVTPSASNSPIFATAGGSSGKLVVKAWNLAGNAIQATFSFAVYKP